MSKPLVVLWQRLCAALLAGFGACGPAWWLTGAETPDQPSQAQPR